jgi:phage-related protein
MVQNRLNPRYRDISSAFQTVTARSLTARRIESRSRNIYCSEMARLLRYRTYFYQTVRRQQPVRDFLRGLPKKHCLKCLAYLERVRVFGTQQPTIYVEKLDDNLWEAKPEYNNIEYRFLFGIIGEGRVGIVTALKKKRGRLPRQELEHAMKLIAEMREHERGRL